MTEIIFSSGPLLAYVLAVAFILGSAMGSFIACMAYRLLHHESIIKGRSHCDHCGHVLGAADLVPIFSWLFLKGRCRYCGAKIPARDLFVELILGISFAGCVLRFGLTGDCIRWMGFACCLMGLSLTDLDAYLIPNRFLAAALVIYAVTIPVAGQDGSAEILFAGSTIAEQLESGLLGAAILGIGMLVLSFIFDRVTGKESLGGGDIKLYFLAGLYLGPWKGLLCLILSCVIGLVFSAAVRKRRIPFGPSIAAAIMLTAFFGQPVVDWYISLL